MSRPDAAALDELPNAGVSRRLAGCSGRDWPSRQVRASTNSTISNACSQRSARADSQRCRPETGIGRLHSPIVR